MRDVLIAVAVTLVALVAVASFAATVHYSWVVKERLLARLATRMGVPYEARQPWWIRWLNR